MRSFLVVVIVVLALCTVLSVRFISGRAGVERANGDASKKHLELPEVDHLAILPIVEYEAGAAGLKTEPGVAYLVKADGEKILFDFGYNKRREEPSPLKVNLQALGVDTRDIQAVVISHPHVDHAGGIEISKSRLAWSTASHTDIGVDKRFASVPIVVDGRQAVVLNEPAMITRLIGSTGSLSAQLFLTGRLQEQALLVCVKGKGVVLVSGCGHPGIVNMVRATKSMTGLPVFAVVGGFHLYFTRCNGGVMPMVVGSDRLFCARPTKASVEKVIRDLHLLGVKQVFLSPHDSDEATLALFKDSFAGEFERVKTGQPIEF